MARKLIQVLLFFFCGILFENGNCQRAQDPYRHSVNLDSLGGRYRLDREVDWETERITFNVTVKTTGYIGFGLSKNGEVEGSDIILGGVDRFGEAYFTDRFEVGGPPTVDQSQDWKLHEAWERNGTTFLSFSRPFDTCDMEHDVAITNDYLAVIWAFGETDDVEIPPKQENSGVYPVYLLDPDLTPDSINNNFPTGPPKPEDFMNVFQITSQVEMTAVDTKYWCSFHKAPTTTKQHIIGYNTVFPSEFDRRHVHHLLLTRCRAPAGSDPDQFFSRAVESGGDSCIYGSPNLQQETVSCGELIHAWGYNGRSIIFPDHVGIPMSENGSEYFMLQTHFDNPDLLTNVNVTVTLEAFYTDEIRENEASVTLIGGTVPGVPSFLLPPNSEKHTIMGHCATGCTSRWIPPEGISVFAVFLHTHTSGRGVRFQHFRGNEELPWISSDDNFNFNYQQVRLLREERRILPGDQLIQTCVYNTMARNGSAVVGGHSTRHEMCMAFAYFYNRIPGFATCASQIETEEYTNLVGISNTTFDRTRREGVITEPAQYAGLSVANYATNNINWDTQIKNDLQRHHRLQPHTSYCPNAVATVEQAAVSRLTGNNAVSVPNGNSNVGNSAMSQYESRFRADIAPFSPPPRCLKQSESRGGNPEAVRPGSETKQKFGRSKFGRGRRENGRGWSEAW